MKTLFKLGVVALAVAAIGTAHAMTKEEMTAKIVGCPNCKAMASYPEMMPNVRPDIFKTTNGFVETFMVTDPKFLPMCAKFDKDCEANMTAAAKMTPAEFQKTYCPVCTGMGALMQRKDVKFEMFNAAMGKVTVATGTTTEGTAACHAFAATMQEAITVMPAAMTEIAKTIKPKMSNDQ